MRDGGIFRVGDVVDVAYTGSDASDVEYVELDATGTVTAVSDGSGPKPAPIRMQMSWNDSQVMRSACQAMVMIPARDRRRPSIGRSL